MPYPVPPPEPPAIIYIAKPKKVALTVAAGDGDTRSNPAEIPEPSPDIVQPEPTPAPAEAAATLLGTTPPPHRPPARPAPHAKATGAEPPEPPPAPAEAAAPPPGPPPATDRPPEMTDPLAEVESGEAVVGFQRRLPVREPETATVEQDSSFTAYQLGSVENAFAIRNRERTAEAQRKQERNQARKQESWYQAQGRQLEDNSPEPAEIPVPEPALELAPSGQQEFDIPTPGLTPAPTTPPAPTPKPKQAAPPGVRTPPAGRTVPFPVSPADTIEVKADSQEFDDKQQIVTAVGNVVVRFRQTVIDADRAIVNLVTRQVVASGNVAYTRGEQVVRGQRMEFNLGLNAGAVEQASGEIFLPTAGSEFTPTLPTDISAGRILEQPLSDRITSQQPVRGVKSPGAATVTLGGGGQLTAPQVVGAVNRVRFEADRLELRPNGGRGATTISSTHAPFSPPELEYRARTARITRISPTAEELVTTKPRLVFDNRVKIPVYPRRQVFDSRQQSGPCLTFGYDGGERGGLFAECGFEVLQNGPVRLTLTPQIYLQRIVAKHGGNPLFPDSYGLRARLRASLGPRTRLDGLARFVTLEDFPNLPGGSLRGC